MEEEIIMGNPIVDPITDDVVLPPTDETLPIDMEIPVDDCPVCSELTQELPNEGIGNFFGTLQESVTIGWRYHLKTRKHHIHVALNDYYYRALQIIDSIIEEYQGINGIIEVPFVNTIVSDGKTEGEYLNELKLYIEENKHVLGCHSEIDSKIDDLLGIIDVTIYKITSFCEHEVKSFAEFCYEDLNERVWYDRYGNRMSDDPDDEDYEPEEE